MKTQFATIVSGILLVAASALAQGDGDAIQAQMKKLGPLFKQITTSVSDASQNAANAGAAQQMIPLFTAVLNLVPDEVYKHPTVDQPAMIEQYKKQIQQEIDDANKLVAALNANDNASALKIVLDMSKDKKSGHDTFNPGQ